MNRLDLLNGGKIGDGSGHPEDAVISARGQTKALDGAIEQAVFGLSQGAVAFGLTIAEPGIGFAAAGQLAIAGGSDPGANNGRGFAAAAGTQFGVIDARHLEFQINPVKQRAGDPRAVAIDLIRRASTASAWIAGMSAGTWIHRRDELEAGRKIGPGARPVKS